MDEDGDLVRALGLLQKIMSPEVFAKCQVMVAPEPKQRKTREQELADRVKNLEKLRGQEASHKGQVDKLELDQQRHRDMLREVLTRISEVSGEVDDLRAQVLSRVPFTSSFGS